MTILNSIKSKGQDVAALVLTTSTRQPTMSAENSYAEHDYKDYTLKNDSGPDLTFTGYLVAWSSSMSHKNHKRWTDLNLYRTKGGVYICEEIGRSTVDGEKDLRQVETAKTDNEVIEFFGDGWLAKKLYDFAGINATIHVA